MKNTTKHFCMKNFKIYFFTFLIFIVQPSFSQTGSDDVEMATLMRSNGKIYIVVAVLATILLGLLLYLIRIDRKVSKLEKQNTSLKN